MSNIGKCIASGILLVALAGHAPASPQAPGCQPDWLPTFGGLSSPAGLVTAFAVFDDGAGSGPALFVGGNMTAVGPLGPNAVVRWNGTLWTALGSGLASTTATPAFVASLTVFDDGSGPALYAGGQFDLAGGNAASCVAKWNGSVWQALGTGITGSTPSGGPIVHAMQVFDDGSGPALYVAGTFTTAGGVAADGVARWDGASWSALGSGVDDTVYALAAFDDGTGPALYAGGEFANAGGSAAARVARWNGTAWSPVAAGFNDTVDALTVYAPAGGTPALYAGGAFFQSGGSPLGGIAKWDGLSWSHVGGGVSLGPIIPPPYASVYALYVFDDGSGPQLVASGLFSNAGSTPANNIARWNGTSWSALSSGAGVVANAMIGFDAGHGAGTQLFLGRFGGMVVWTGTAFGQVGGSQLSTRIDSLAVFDDGLGGGPALIASGGAPGNIARWSGSTWTALGAGLAGTAFALAVWDDGLGGGPGLFASGNFPLAGGASANRIAKWNGSAWSTLSSGLDGFTPALAVYDDGGGAKLYAGGNFTLAGGQGASRVARWDGVAWSALGLGVNGPVRELCAWDDGTGPALFAGGEFTQAGGGFVYRIARWSGTAWSDLAGGMDNYVSALCVFDDGTGEALFAGGVFTTAGGTNASRVAKWNGVAWSPLGAGVDGEVETLAVFDDGSGAALYAGGAFTHAGGAPAAHVAKWDGAQWSALGAGVPANVHVVKSIDTGAGATLHVGGDFQTSPGGDTVLARFGCAPGFPTPYCSGDGSGTACPCGNAGASGHGCANSVFASGARLAFSGSASISLDTFVLLGSSMPQSSVLYFQGTTQTVGGLGAVFGDGLRCASGAIVRLGTKTNSSGASQLPEPGGAGISVLGGNGVGSVRTYQGWYRNSAAFCTPLLYNLTNGLALTWRP